MKGKFGKFIAEKRKDRGLTLRGLATELGIAPAYMSDIEKGNRYPPDKEKLYELSRILGLSKVDTDYMFDLAAGEKENTVSPDLPEYIMGTEQARVALRLARDINATNDVWKQVIQMMEERKRGSQ
ncbi:helix-turn-helix transcriptional regulator [Anaerobiospirillum succiniciproducens]|uniref:helix-turn-helix domain-containing protein n=1 Tax=Anaerobiospirillum succiniciproducens TaxID=13335 RepID=UPI002942D2A7|nr:helix-turn-helix transcriptional regulator [Anaerobiospirillum succiniciproducens]